MSEWKTRKIDELAKVIMGQSPPGSLVIRRKQGLPFLQGNAQFGPRFPRATLQCDEAPRRSARGDSLISVRAPVGEINRSDCAYGIGRGLAAVTFDGIDPDFGHYALVERSRDLHRVSQGTTFSAIDRSDLEDLRMPVPPLEEQRRIAEVLDSIDETIQATERVIAKHQAIRAGLAADLLSMTSKRTEWRQARVGSLVGLAYGSALGKEDRAGQGFPVFGSNGVIGHHDTPLVSGPGIIVGRKGSIGALHWSDDDFWPIDTTYWVRPRVELDLRWLAEALKTCGLETLDSSTGVPGLNRNDAYECLVTFPPLEEQRRIAGILDTADDTIRSYEQELKKLRQLRAGVAADLLSGRVRTGAA